MKLAWEKPAAILAILVFATIGCRRAEADPPALDVLPRVVTLTARPANTSRETPPPTLSTQTPLPMPTPIPPTPSPTIEVRDWHEAYAFQHIGDYDRAIQGYRTLLAGQPSEQDLRTIRFHLGETYLLNGDPSAAAEVLSGYVVSYPDDATAWFLLGRAHLELQDWAGAVDAFRAYRRLDDTLADYAGLRIAEALERLGRTEEAVREYETVARITLDSHPSTHSAQRLAARALEGLAEIALAQNDMAGAAEWYSQAAQQAPEATEQARLLGLAGKSYLAAGRLTDTLGVLQEVVGKYLATGSSYLAAGELLLLGQTVNQRTLGLIYYYNGDHRAAVEALRQYLDSEPAPSGDALYFLGRSYERLGRWSSAIDAYQQLIDQYPNNERYGAAWVRKARAQRHLGDTDAAIATFREFARAEPANPLVDNALWEAARALEALGRREEAAELYHIIVERYPRGDMAAGAGFRVGILPYLDGDYAAAREAWHLAADRAGTAELRARFLLWAGKSALALGESAAAKDFATAVHLAPLNFDGLRARELLAELDPEATDNLVVGPPPSSSSWLRTNEDALAGIDRRIQTDRRYLRGRALLAVGLRDEGLAELKALRDAYWELPAHLSRLAVLLDDASTRHLSISSAERALRLTGTSPLEAPAEVARLAYPVDFADLIRAESERNGLDPRLLVALIRQESRFNPTATSYAGARGLTQVIPSTGWFIAGKLGMGDFHIESLYRPYRSIAFGAWYLADQLHRFGDPILALAAYNGGPGNGQRWQRLTDDPDMLVASIHLDQTQEYVRRVIEQYAVYQALYDEELAVISHR